MATTIQENTKKIGVDLNDPEQVKKEWTSHMSSFVICSHLWPQVPWWYSLARKEGVWMSSLWSPLHFPFQFIRIPQMEDRRVDSFHFGHRTRFVVLILSTLCLTFTYSNSLALNFTVICMGDVSDAYYRLQSSNSTGGRGNERRNHWLNEVIGCYTNMFQEQLTGWILLDTKTRFSLRLLWEQLWELFLSWHSWGG